MTYQQWLSTVTADTGPRYDTQNTVTINRSTYEQLARQAGAFRDFRLEISSSDQLLGFLAEIPSVRELLLSEYAEYVARQQATETGEAVSGLTTGASRHVSYTELERRRAQRGQLHEEFTDRHGGEYRGGPVDWATGAPTARAMHDAA